MNALSVLVVDVGGDVIFERHGLVVGNPVFIRRQNLRLNLFGSPGEFSEHRQRTVFCPAASGDCSNNALPMQIVE